MADIDVFTSAEPDKDKGYLVSVDAYSLVKAITNLSEQIAKLAEQLNGMQSQLMRMK
jgi:hypothetical protein